jgi:alpha-galactosidase
VTLPAIALHSDGSSILLECPETGAPVWRYWGPRLVDDALPPAPLTDRPRPSFATDEDIPFSILPSFGLGWTGQSALLAHRGGGDFAQGFVVDRVEREGTSGALIVLRDDIAKLRAAVSLELDPVSDVLTISTRLTNTGDTAIDVQWLAAGCLPLPASVRAVRSYGGRHNYEFVADDAALGRSLWRRENRRGLTSHEDFPGAVVSGDGMAFGAQLAWSGNHAQTIEPLDDGRFQWQMGEWLAPGEVQLEPGETMASPEMLATCARDAGGVARNFHAAIRKRSPLAPGKPRPVHLNTWEALYFDHREDDLKSLADAAAAIGIERFVLDDGWFKGRNNDMSSLGDWTVDPAKYPHGLGPLAHHVTGLGMEFGLWVEPEMVNPDSDLFRAHPEWALQLAGRPMITARNQLVLDLSQAAVVDYLGAALEKLLRDLPVSYLKWDHNRMLAPAGNRVGTASYRAQVFALYALLDRLRAAFPDVEIESCAGGGGRIDAGIAQRTHRFWTSDTTDAVTRLEIQRGFLQFMPPELMGAHVGSAPVHTTGRTQALDFRAAVALPGHFGIELDPRTLEDGERARLAQWIARYKDLRATLHSGGVWRGDAGDGVIWQAHGDAETLILFAYRTDPPARRYPPSIALPMLDADARYTVEPITGDRAQALEMTGGWLVAAGLELPATRAERCAIFRLCKQR